MDVTSVTLNEVIAAAGVRAASLVPETSGYLALAVADASSRLPFRLEDPMVSLTTEGTVKVARGNTVIAPDESARRMRDMLARLLAHSIGSAPALAAASRPRGESPEGVDGFIRELEAALVPVNRAAARRALARLARETARARHAGRLRRRRSRRAEEEAVDPSKGTNPPARSTPAAVGSPSLTAPALPSSQVAWTEPDLARLDDQGVDVEFSDQPNLVVDAEDARLASDGQIPTGPQLSLWEEAPTTIDAQVDLVAEPAPTQVPAGHARGARAPFSLGVAKSDVDDLLSRFAVSELTTPEGIEKTRAALKKLAGLEPTPPPPTAHELRRLTGRAPAVASRPVETQLVLRRATPAVADRGRTTRALTIGLVALGLVLAGLLGHYLPSWFSEARANAEATP